ncbi:MAG: hypothetical protein JWM74_2652 [Myxococcaceae bacterium]|nr:hypothetical protein [Myxococcaceae bacterium]
MRTRLARGVVGFVASLAVATTGCGSDVFHVASDGGASSDASDDVTQVDATVADAAQPDAPVLDVPTLDGGRGFDGGPGVTPGKLQCGSEPCDLGNNKYACCVSRPQPTGAFAFACVSGTNDGLVCNDPTTGTQVFMRCGATSNCSMECCLRKDAQPGHYTSFCIDDCTQGVELCDLSLPTAVACKGGSQVCKRPAALTMLPGGYGTCGGAVPQ